MLLSLLLNAASSSVMFSTASSTLQLVLLSSMKTMKPVSMLSTHATPPNAPVTLKPHTSEFKIGVNKMLFLLLILEELSIRVMTSANQPAGFFTPVTPDVPWVIIHHVCPLQPNHPPPSIIILLLYHSFWHSMTSCFPSLFAWLCPLYTSQGEGVIRTQSVPCMISVLVYNPYF